jgi:hypothetical protein
MKQRFTIQRYSKTIFWIILTGLLVSFTTEGLGQIWKLRRYEIGGGLGNTQVFGDIGGAMTLDNWMGLRDIQLNETRPSINLVARYKLNGRFAIRTSLVNGYGHGNDKPPYRERGRSYNTTIVELSSNLETYFIQELRPYRSHAGYRRLGMVNNYNMFALYGFVGGGIAYTRANPYIPPANEMKYDIIEKNHFIPVIPFGIGLKYILNDVWILDANLGYRYTFSDFVEGYTTNNNSQYNDVYYVLSVSVVYRLRTTKRNIPAIFDRQYKAQFR